MVKKVKRKFNFKKFLMFLLILCMLVLFGIYITKKPIKSILVKGTYFLTDEDVIEEANLENYPSFVKTTSLGIKKKLSNLSLVKSVKVSKEFGYRLVIDITEYKVLFKIRSSNEYVLDTGKRVSDLDLFVPILINYVPDEIFSKTIQMFSRVDEDVILKISEIEYSPNNYDKERFILYMNDDNVVYITLNKIKEFNDYNKIKDQLGSHKGVLYLDSGNYFEIKE